jgi:hypothetical protein
MASPILGALLEQGEHLKYRRRLDRRISSSSAHESQQGIEMRKIHRSLYTAHLISDLMHGKGACKLLKARRNQCRLLPICSILSAPLMISGR